MKDEIKGIVPVSPLEIRFREINSDKENNSEGIVPNKP
jgi:hypothetical protein